MWERRLSTFCAASKDCGNGACACVRLRALILACVYARANRSMFACECAYACMAAFLPGVQEPELRSQPEDKTMQTVRKNEISNARPTQLENMTDTWRRIGS
eukprot:6204901-Pleurochrysis_carterae.AAC.2